MQCVILCGGFGTRMLPITENIPKSMIDINGKPFIDYQLSWITNQGIDNIILNIGHLGNIIRDYVGEKFNDADITYVEEGDKLLGTAGALRLSLPHLDNLFLVTYGDSFLPINYVEPLQYCQERGIESLMTVYKNNNQFDKSNVFMDKSCFIYDKGAAYKNFEYIDYGLSVLSKGIVKNYIPSGKYGLSDLFYDLSFKNILRGYEVYDRFYEIGSFAGLNDFKTWVNKNGKCFNRS
jgi:NDP-sugar pyrophosphorylase family protein